MSAHPGSADDGPRALRSETVVSESKIGNSGRRMAGALTDGTQDL